MRRKPTNDHWSEYDDMAPLPEYDPTSASTSGVSIDDYMETDDRTSRQGQSRRQNARMWLIIGGVGAIGLWLLGLLVTMKGPDRPTTLQQASAPTGQGGTQPFTSRPGSGSAPAVPGPQSPTTAQPLTSPTASSPGSSAARATLGPERLTQLSRGVVGFIASRPKPRSQKNKSDAGAGESLAGTGFLVDAKGYVLTNAHLVQGIQQVEVFTPDRQWHKAEVVQRDTQSDVALLKLSGLSTFPPLVLGDSSRVQEGEEIYVLGYPLEATLGWEPTTTKGSVRSIRSPSGTPWVQTNARVNKGNDGGPMVRASTGEVIGIVTFKGRGPESTTTARPLNTVRDWLVRHIR